MDSSNMKYLIYIGSRLLMIYLHHKIIQENFYMMA